jgi:molybdopterin-containing oxidoreductase family iron-sulfur binding subunit
MKRLPIVDKKTPAPNETVWYQTPAELTDDPSVHDKRVSEFEEGGWAPPAGVDRRTFLTLMGASMALGGLATGCRRPEERILPYTKRPEDLVDGKPVYYATSAPAFGSAIGLLVKSNDGRPTKIEGNPEHPSSLGGTTAFQQAMVLDLYDPDRSQWPMKRGQGGHAGASAEEAWTFLGDLGRDARAKKGKGLALLIEEHRSPTTAAAIATLLKEMPAAKVVRFESFGREMQRAGHEAVLGKPLDASLDLTKADVVVVLDGDILGSEPDAVKHSKAFSKRRRPEAEKALLGGVASPMARWYVAEAAPTVTGMGADHRLRIQGRRVLDLAKALGAALKGAGANLAAELAGALGDAKLSEAEQKWVAAAAKDLVAANGAGVVVAGLRQPPAVHALVAGLNAALGCVGHAVRYVAPLDLVAEGLKTLSDLTQEMNAGSVDTVVVLGGNPVFAAPADVPFEAALAKVKTSVHVGHWFDETGKACSWHIPRAHFLESWSDTASVDGTLSIVQPLIAPIFGGRTDAEVLERLVGGSRTPYELVQATWGQVLGSKDFDKAFRRVLHDGLLAVDEEAAKTAADVDLLNGGAAPTFNGANAAQTISAHQAPAGEFEVLFAPDPHAYDGRFANNGWLMELPAPIHKSTWGNYAAVSAATAKKLGVESGDHLDVTVGSRSITIPVIVSYGHADDSVTLPVGLGRAFEGRVCKGVGVNVGAVRTGAGWFLSAGSVKKGAGHTKPAVTQGHFMMEGRPLIRTQTVASLREDPKWASELVQFPGKGKPEGENNQLWPEWKYDGHKWAMTLDLTLCTGCSACVTACQAENNIPILGVDGVMRSREMHWIRIDRYFEGRYGVADGADDANAANMPMLCQHCENAPCEQVCPVAATTHSPEGINEMTYNRCIGTKYCGNNCPFKVRRFNYFNYTKDIPDLAKLQLNPDVTVRSRGVMEKCTYCVQRVNQAKIAAKQVHLPTKEEEQAEKRRIMRSFTSACAQACPTEAITFGDLNDPGDPEATRAPVSKTAALGRAYHMLEELNVRPRTTYLARIRNPNPELEPPKPSAGGDKHEAGASHEGASKGGH